MINPSDFIKQLNKLHPDMVKGCTQGNCYQLHLLLKMVYPKAVAYYGRHHVITKIGNAFYDITGRVIREDHLPMNEHNYPEQLLQDALQWKYKPENINAD